MAKLLQKALKESLDAGSCKLGARAASSASGSRLIVVSRSAPESVAGAAEAAGVPVLRFGGSSVDLSRLCGRQHRVSALAFTSLAESSVKAIVAESEKEWRA